VGGSQPGKGGLGHPWTTYMSPKLFLLLAYLKFPLRDNITKKCFWGIAEEGVVPLQYLFRADKGQQTPPIKGNCLFFPWGSFGHKVSELLSSIVKVPHGDLGCL
jgi:hypothetical protein